MGSLLCRYRFAGFEGRGFQRLVEVIDQVVNALQADRETDELGRDTRLLLLLRRQLPVRGAGGWMMSDLASPTFARCEKSSMCRINCIPASSPPLMPKPTMAP